MIIAIIIMVLIFGITVISEARMRKKDNEIAKLKSDTFDLQKSISEQTKFINSAEIKYNDLKSLQTYIDNTMKFALLTLQGDIIHISEKLREMLELPKEYAQLNFIDYVTTVEGQQQYIADLLQIPRSQIWEKELPITTKSNKEYWCKMTIIPQVQQGRTPAILLICQDITGYIESKKDVDKINKINLEQEIQSQRNIALKVIQAQELERDRIGKDMHDGIGQILTALKFNIESINLEKPEKAQQKLELIKQISGDIIKRVREVTFNLRPPELGDYGIDKGLSKLASGVSTFTGKKVIYENKSGFSQRLEPEIETNLYRITQEAVNNSVKYADSSCISILLNHSDDMLSIKVIDDGIGFESSLKSDGQDLYNGNGLSSMKERAKYINGRIFVNSKLGEGSKITINIPLKKELMQERV